MTGGIGSRVGRGLQAVAIGFRFILATPRARRLSLVPCLAAAIMFLWALLLGVWKYRQIVESEESLAHPYVDVAHRAALLYSFALLLVATFVELHRSGILGKPALRAQEDVVKYRVQRS